MAKNMTNRSAVDSIEDAGVAEQLKIKTALIDCIRGYIAKEGITQQEAADRMGVHRSRIGDISRGHISAFSIDALVAMMARVDLHPVKIAV